MVVNSDVLSTLPSPLASLFRAAKAFRVTYSKRRCFPPVRLGYVELAERDWENAVQGIGNPITTPLSFTVIKLSILTWCHCQENLCYHYLLTLTMGHHFDVFFCVASIMEDRCTLFKFRSCRNLIRSVIYGISNY